MTTTMTRTKTRGAAAAASRLRQASRRLYLGSWRLPRARPLTRRRAPRLHTAIPHLTTLVMMTCRRHPPPQRLRCGRRLLRLRVGLLRPAPCSLNPRPRARCRRLLHQPPCCHPAPRRPPLLRRAPPAASSRLWTPCWTRTTTCGRSPPLLLPHLLLPPLHRCQQRQQRRPTRFAPRPTTRSRRRWSRRGCCLQGRREGTGVARGASLGRASWAAAAARRRHASARCLRPRPPSRLGAAAPVRPLCCRRLRPCPPLHGDLRAWPRAPPMRGRRAMSRAARRRFSQRRRPRGQRLHRTAAAAVHTSSRRLLLPLSQSSPAASRRGLTCPPSSRLRHSRRLLLLAEEAGRRQSAAQCQPGAADAHAAAPGAAPPAPR